MDVKELDGSMPSKKGFSFKKSMVGHLQFILLL